MDFNTFFVRFGLDSSNFTNKPVEIIETPTGYIYEADEEYKQRICPNCNHQFLHIHFFTLTLLNVMSPR